MLPSAAILLTSQAHALLAAAMAAAGEGVGDVRATQVTYRPGRSITATYRVDVAGRPATLVARGGAGVPDGAVVLEDGELRVGVWRYPNDPVLPGLRHAVDGELLPRLLAELGVHEHVTGVRRRSYRPTRRAVVEVATPQRRLFLKVVRPERAAALLAQLDALASHPAAPRLAGAAPGLGVVALEELPGTALRDALADDAAGPLPDAADLAGLLDRLPDLAARATSPLERAADHAALLAAVVPDLAPRVRDLAGGLGRLAPGDPAPVHGDFHPGQVMVAGGAASGLVDVDAAGMGERIDDLATMLGYLAAVTADPAPPHRAAAYGAALHAAFAREADPAELRRRVAAATLGFATLPFVAQRPGWQGLVRLRVQRAAAWATGLAGLWA